MSVRKIVVLAAAASLLAGTGGVANAARPKPKPKKPTCNLITDRTDDATGSGNATVQLPQSEPTLDITSADIATNGTHITVVIRVASLGTSTTSALGRAYDVTFTAGKSAVAIRGIVSPAGSSWMGGKATGVEDVAKKEVRITVPISALEDMPLKPNDKLTGLSANTWRWVGNTNAVIGRADTAQSTATYLHTWPSCVKVGS